MTVAAEAPGADYSRTILVRLFALTVVFVLLPVFLLSAFALNMFERDLLPEMDKQAQVIGRTVARQVDRAVQLRVPFDQLVEVEDSLEPLLKANPEVRFIAIVGPNRTARYVRGLAQAEAQRVVDELPPSREDVEPARLVGSFYASQIAIGAADSRLGTVVIGIDEAFVQRQVQEILYDIIVVSIVSLLVTFELLLFITALTISHPIGLVQRMMAEGQRGDYSVFVAGAGQNEMGLLARGLNAISKRMQDLFAQLSADVMMLGSGTARRGEELLARVRHRFTLPRERGGQQIRAGNLIFVRTPLFLFVFAEELSRSFFPIYVRELYDPSTGLSADLAIGLPISVFMLIAAIATPIAGVWSDRVGRRPIFLLGALPAAVGLALTGFAQGFWDLLAFRCISAAGYGMVFIACQGYVLDNTTKENRAKGIAIYVGAIMAADICGPAIGGIMADRVGFRATFVLAAMLTLISSLMVYQILSDDTGEREQRKSLTAGDFGLLLSNGRFLALLALAAMPAKMVLTGFLFYLAPLYLLSLGNSQSSIGRVMMAYGIATLMITPLAASLADRLNRNMLFVAVGGLVAGAGLLSVLALDGTWAMVAAIAMLGIGQAISISPQLALVPQICQHEIDKVGITTTIAVYRIVERLGGVVGPFLVGALVAFGGYASAVVGTGLILIGCVTLFVLFFAIRPPQAAKENG